MRRRHRSILPLVGLAFAISAWAAPHTVSAESAADPAWPGGINIARLIQQDFARYDPDYAAHRAALERRIGALQDRLIEIEAGGPSLPCSHMTEAQRERAGFVDDPSFYSMPADAYYYGIAFLDVIGFWDRAKRFWTERKFDGATAIACRIRAELRKLGAEAAASRDAVARLRGACAD
jgi:hypothetical protein